MHFILKIKKIENIQSKRYVLHKQRKEKIERSFADSKNNHSYRYAMYKGIEKIGIILGL